MGLKHSYTLIAPFYDLVVAKATHAIRKTSLQQIQQLSRHGDKILITGIGTGLDIPHLPADRFYTGIDLTPGMLNKAARRKGAVNITLQLGDAMNLPYEGASFDLIVMHLILAVVPDPQLALREAQRVVKTRGHILILDKFLKPGQLALLRRLANPITRHIATQTTVVFEHLLEECKSLAKVEDEPVLAGGWFRRIVLQKTKD
ncbi:MAG: methyltransferase domain-containing protein [Gammaproteobacteria bacterium]|nr:methyltransferase domain-containing protein [Gammaproteobacteria bacterium]